MGALWEVFVMDFTRQRHDGCLRTVGTTVAPQGKSFYPVKTYLATPLLTLKNAWLQVLATLLFFILQYRG